jgi:hypothetical protein
MFNMHQTWSKDSDARITVFAKCANVLRSTQLAVTYIEMKLHDRKWWEFVAGKDIPDKDIDHFRSEFDTFIRVGFIQLLFASIESSFRLVLMALDPKEYERKRRSFKLVYEDLLERTRLQCWKSLLELLSLVRNTLHNNGVYFPLHGGDCPAVWKRKTYMFRVGKPVDFVSWKFLLGLLSDLNEMLLAVMTSDKVAASPSVVDPAAP